MQINEITQAIIGAGIEVHHLGPGLLESAYRVCLAYELRNFTNSRTTLGDLYLVCSGTPTRPVLG